MGQVRCIDPCSFTSGHEGRKPGIPLGGDRVLEGQGWKWFLEKKGRPDSGQAPCGSAWLGTLFLPRRLAFDFAAGSREIQFPNPFRLAWCIRRPGPKDSLYLLGRRVSVPGREGWPVQSVSPRVNQKVAPLSGSASVQIRPPCLEMILCTVTMPIPVPGNSSEPCSLWKGAKRRST